MSQCIPVASKSAVVVRRLIDLHGLRSFKSGILVAMGVHAGLINCRECMALFSCTLPGGAPTRKISKPLADTLFPGSEWLSRGERDDEKIKLSVRRYIFNLCRWLFLYP
jgi:hypothetical protein